MLTGYALLILTAGCGGEESTLESFESFQSSPVYVTAVDPGEFRVSEMQSNTVVQDWMGSGSADVIRVFIDVGDSLAEGDTVLTLREELYGVERERLEMELAMSSAMLSSRSGDSSLALRVDSLSVLLDSMSGNENTAFLSPIGGVVTGIPVEAGQLLDPGSPLVQLSETGSSLYLIEPPRGCTVVSWPLNHHGVRFVEEIDGQGVYSGGRDQLELLFSKAAALQRSALYESGLESFLLTRSSDTVYVERLGHTQEGLILVLPEREVTSQVRTWTDR